MAAIKRCPKCKQRLPAPQYSHYDSPPKAPAARICSKCGGPIDRGHKFTFEPDGRLKHRHCDNPNSYLPKEKRRRA